MKSIKPSLSSGIFLLFLIVNNLTAQWVQVSNGMGNIIVNALAYGGNSIIAGCGGTQGVFVSTNNGDNWTQTVLNNRHVTSLAVNGNYIFAGTDDYPVFHGLYRSTNNGISWDTTTLINLPVTSLAINGNYVLAGLYNFGGVYKSTDNGLTWIQSLTNLSVWSLAANGNNVFAGCFGAMGVFRSTNNGGNWNQALSNKYIGSLVVNGNNVFAGITFGNTGPGIFLSADTGATWNPGGLNAMNVGALAINGNNIFAGTSGNGIYVSYDNGVNWQQRNEGLGNLNANALCKYNNYIFVGSGAGVYRRPLSELTNIHAISNEIPDNFMLSQNYPNPFNPVTRIKFEIPKSKSETNPKTEIRIYDMLGKEIAVLVNEQLNPGIYEVSWDASNYPSGVYYYRLNAGHYSKTKKMILIK